MPHSAVWFQRARLSSALDSEEDIAWSDAEKSRSLLLRLAISAETRLATKASADSLSADSLSPRSCALRQLSQTREDLTPRCCGNATRARIDEQLWQTTMPHALPTVKIRTVRVGTRGTRAAKDSSLSMTNLQ